MQNIINQIIAGELTQKQLIESLAQYENNQVDDYNEAVDAVENLQFRTQKLEADARAREDDIKVISQQGLKAVDYAKKLEAENIRLKGEVKEIKMLRNENKSLKKLKAKHIESSKKQLVRVESLTKDCRDYRETIQKLKSDNARLRLTGWKEMGRYSFSLFPSRTDTVEDGKVEKRVSLFVMDKLGNMKVIGVDSDGEVTQPRSHNFKFNEEQLDFIKSFDQIARADGYQFTNRVLQLVN